MTSSSRLHSVLDLACERSAVRYAKGHADAVLRDWGLPEDLAYDALTVVAELASNAVRHAGAEAKPFAPDCGQPHVPRCELTLWIAADRLCIAMYDESPRPPLLRPPSAESENGRGLQLVNGLSDGAWGYQPAAHRPGKAVWAQLPVTAGVPPEPALTTTGNHAVTA
ncbi:MULTISPECIES: ATP-binding protein [unclassified Streptomyces]|uniref:ATP-binding protein n=1 Tax=unclassified Streptomyces TaxID=2593676 RepID=UPI003812CC09